MKLGFAWGFECWGCRLGCIGCPFLATGGLLRPANVTSCQLTLLLIGAKPLNLAVLQFRVCFECLLPQANTLCLKDVPCPAEVALLLKSSLNCSADTESFCSFIVASHAAFAQFSCSRFAGSSTSSAEFPCRPFVGSDPAGNTSVCDICDICDMSM